ncbi:MPXVgp021 [Monkeypox virus]|uniref:MPXVgp021 n=1 Tax=Monkeypox virus TaxID=10244 RepID=A0A7H0DLG3_MONPV|nr:D18L [Monkeypox virus]QNP12346.1 MPXVgp021 [Monkeypox virus]QNP12708.1 MPXVgp021 [Monkeypox virus]QNP13065.1 MPXVgp021 [Monkeypox virus]QNP13252.1 MPXVgp021 [Monkeypox virus]
MRWKKINITINNVEMILVAAIIIDVPPVIDLCVKTMIHNINSTNCIRMFNFSKRYGIKKLYNTSMSEIINNITAVTSDPGTYFQNVYTNKHKKYTMVYVRSDIKWILLKYLIMESLILLEMNWSTC